MRNAVFALILSFPVFSQPVPDWENRLKDYYDHRKPVYLHLFFNQPYYAPGDTAYFRVAFLDAATLLPLKGFHVINLDVVQPDGRVIKHQEFRIRDGWGNNQLVITPDLKPGLYRIYAYNNWMKNFGIGRFYQGELMVSATSRFQRQPRVSEIHIGAEGGKLVAGVQNRLVVAGPVHGVLEILNDNNQILVRQPADSSGLSTLFFTPPAAGDYTLRWNNLTRGIPAWSDGIVIRLIPARFREGSHRLMILTPEASSIRKEELYLIISSHDQVSLIAKVNLQEKNTAILNIPAHSLPEGIHYVTLNRPDGETLASRLMYNPGSDPVCTVTLSSDHVSTRENTTVHVKVSDAQGNPVQALLSVTVYNQDLFHDTPAKQFTLEEYIRWRGSIDVPLSPLDDFSDNLLILSRWPWYTWREVLGRLPANDHLFTDFQRISGKVRFTNDTKTIPDSTSIYFLVSQTGDLYNVPVQRDGHFSLSFLFSFFGTADLYYRIEKGQQKLSNAFIQLDTSTIRYPERSDPVIAHQSLQDTYGIYAIMRNQVLSSYRYYNKVTVSTGPAHTSTLLQVLEKLIGSPDVVIDLDDYVLFPTMQETLHEIIPYLQYRRAGKRESLRMYLPELARSGEESPLFIIDGALTDNPAYFLQLNPADVDKIKIVYSLDKLEKLGGMARSGLVLVETKVPGLDRTIAEQTTNLKINGLNPAASFPVEPEVWQKDNEHAPRLRPTLYFNPLIRLSEQGEAVFSFQTADDTGTYVIKIEGLTTDGKPFTYRQMLKVLFRPQ
jgi:hypothetical protein